MKRTQALVLLVLLSTRSEAIAAPSRVAGVVKRPVLVRRVEPKCHFWYRCKPAVLEATINQGGFVRDVKVIAGQGSRCTDAAIAALHEWKYQGATLNDQPVAVIWKFTVERCNITPANERLQHPMPTRQRIASALP